MSTEISHIQYDRLKKIRELLFFKEYEHYENILTAFADELENANIISNYRSENLLDELESLKNKITQLLKDFETNTIMKLNECNQH